jgi:hypothetical protein
MPPSQSLAGMVEKTARSHGDATFACSQYRTRMVLIDCEGCQPGGCRLRLYLFNRSNQPVVTRFAEVFAIVAGDRSFSDLF